MHLLLLGSLKMSWWILRIALILEKQMKATTPSEWDAVCALLVRTLISVIRVHLAVMHFAGKAVDVNFQICVELVYKVKSILGLEQS